MRIELSSRRELDSEGCKSTKNRPKSVLRAPRRVPEPPRKSPKTFGDCFQVRKFAKNICRKRSSSQHCKNMKIELSCRRELDSEGCEVSKNRAKIDQNRSKINQNQSKIDENRTRKSHKAPQTSQERPTSAQERHKKRPRAPMRAQEPPRNPSQLIFEHRSKLLCGGHPPPVVHTFVSTTFVYH